MRPRRGSVTLAATARHLGIYFFSFRGKYLSKNLNGLLISPECRNSNQGPLIAKSIPVMKIPVKPRLIGGKLSRILC